MIMVRRAALKRRLLERDGHQCGVHVGGCGRKLTLATTTIDHIVPQNILRVSPEIYDQLASDESFLQPMCQDCNSARKQGRIAVEFTCKCHSASFFILFGKPELLISYEKRYVTRRLRIPAEESPDGTYLYVWGVTKKGTVGYESDKFGGVFAYPPSSPDESDVIRTFRPVCVRIHKELRALSSKIQVVQLEHQDLRLSAKEAYPIFAALNDLLQKPVQAFVQQQSVAFLKCSRAISSVGELTALGATRHTSRLLPDASQRFVRQMSSASLELDRAFASPSMQKALAGIREMERAFSQANLYLKRQHAFVSSVRAR